MMNNNYFQFIGARLTRDPEIKYTPTQIAMCNLIIAVNHWVKNKNGEWENKTDFPRVTVYGKTAESLADYSAKGLRVNVFGRIKTGSYEKNGMTFYTTNLVVDSLDIVDFKDRPKEKEPEPPAFTEFEADIPF